MGEVCKHGQLERQCDVCQLKKELVEIKAASFRMKEELDDIFSLVGIESDRLTTKSAFYAVKRDVENTGRIISEIRADNTALREICAEMMLWLKDLKESYPCAEDDQDGHVIQCQELSKVMQRAREVLG